MRVRTTAAVTLAMVAGVGIGAAVAPVAYGQSKVRAKGEPSIVKVEPSSTMQVFRGGSRIGVSIQDVDEEAAKRAKLPAIGGVLIEDVTADSPAEKAGFKAGDIVVEFDGERVRSSRQFSRLVQETPADREVQAVVVRDGQRTTLLVRPEASGGFRYFGDFDGLPDIRIAPRPPVPPTPPTLPPPPARPAPDVFELLPEWEGFWGGSGRLGITVSSLSEQLGDYFGAKEGVLVTSVADNSTAAKAGLKAGDVIVSIDGSAVDSPSALSRQVRRLEEGHEFTLEIVREKNRQTLKGKVEARQSRRWTTRTVI
jgi:serine protease Do